MIDSYSFGHMSIDGQACNKDVIILPDGSVISPWWRKTGHELVLSDIQAILETKPDFLVIGTGSSGLMKPHSVLESDLEARGIKVIVFPSEKAVEKYNSMTQQKHNVAACFHLTC